jgi:hypothetical protein
MQSKDSIFPIEVGRVTIRLRTNNSIQARWQIDKVPYNLSFGLLALHHCETICVFFLILKVSNLGSIAK